MMMWMHARLAQGRRVVSHGFPKRSAVRLGLWREAGTSGMEAQIGKWPACTAQLAGRPLGNIEEIALGQEVLLAIHLQEPFPIQDHAGDVYLGIDVQRHSLSVVKPEEIAVQIWALQGKDRALESRLHV
jgi:hypothetical protein